MSDAPRLAGDASSRPADYATTLVLAATSTARTLATAERVRQQAPHEGLLVAAPLAEAWRYRQAGIQAWTLGELWLNLDPGPSAPELAARGVQRIVLPVGPPRQSLFFLARWLRSTHGLALRLGSSHVELASNSILVSLLLRLATVLWWGPLSVTLHLTRALDTMLLLAAQVVARVVGPRLRSGPRSTDAPVCHVVQSLGTGGAQRQLVEYLKCTRAHQVPARLLVLVERENLFAHELTTAGIPTEIVCHPTHMGRLGRAALSAFPSTTSMVMLWRRLRRLAPRATMSWFFQANLIAAPAARLAGVPRVVSSIRNLSAWKTWPGVGARWYRLADHLSAPVNDRIVANAAAVAADYVRYSGVPSSKVEVVANGIDMARATDARPAALRRDLGIPDEQTLLVTMGRFAPEKDHATLLECAAGLVGRGHDIALLIIGHGSLEKQLTRLIAELEIADRAHFLGRVDEPLAVLLAADLFVLSSRIEGMPNAVMEAQACGLAVVATDSGGTAEVVEHGRTGLIVPIADVAAMTDAIATLIDDPARRAAMGRRGRERMGAHFSLVQMAAGIDRVTNRV